MDSVTVEKYLWQGLTRLLAVYDGSDNLLKRFEYADIRMPVAMTSGGSTYYLTYDQVGSLRVVADATGNVIKRIDYDSFGNIVDDTDPTFEIPFGFAGGLHDRDTGLVRFGFRDYDPDVGRWTAKDPILFAGGDTDLYGYCLNDPINLVDPDGRIPLVIAIPTIFATTSFAVYASELLIWLPVLRDIDKRLIYLTKKIYNPCISSKERKIYIDAYLPLLKGRAYVASKIGWATMQHEYQPLPF